MPIFQYQFDASELTTVFAELLGEAQTFLASRDSGKVERRIEKPEERQDSDYTCQVEFAVMKMGNTFMFHWDLEQRRPKLIAGIIRHSQEAAELIDSLTQLAEQDSILTELDGILDAYLVV